MQPKSDIRVVGSRTPYSRGLEGAQEFFELAIQLRGGQPFLPKGVYRFTSYEDEHAWTLKMLTRPKAARPQDAEDRLFLEAKIASKKA